jgi:hypothetical protein
MKRDRGKERWAFIEDLLANPQKYKAPPTLPARGPARG